MNLFNAGKTGPYCWIALEYIEGESVAQALERLGTKPNWKHALRLAVHGARAVAFRASPTLFHLTGYSDRKLLVVGWAGVVLSVLAITGLFDGGDYPLPFASIVAVAKMHNARARWIGLR